MNYRLPLHQPTHHTPISLYNMVSIISRVWFLLFFCCCCFFSVQGCMTQEQRCCVSTLKANFTEKYEENRKSQLINSQNILNTNHCTWHNLQHIYQVSSKFIPQVSGSQASVTATRLSPPKRQDSKTRMKILWEARLVRGKTSKSVPCGQAPTFMNHTFICAELISQSFLDIWILCSRYLVRLSYP